MRSGLKVWLGLACVFGPVVGARGQATLVADAHVSSARPAVNAGTLTNLNVGGGYTALVQFDLSMLPAGTTASQVTRAVLRVYCNRADTVGLVAVQPVGAVWGEYSVTYATMPVLGAAVQTGQVSAADTFVTFDVTGTVQGWVAAPASNFGLALSAGTAVVQFDSKENDETGHAPELQIVLAAGGVGTQGPVGPQGPVGIQGVAGLQGAQGVQGVTGLIGVQGPQGLVGAAGPAGPIGLQGPQGVAGAEGVGVPGPVGPAGPVGPVGLQGPPGVAGADGAPGVAGANGLPGLVYQGVYASTANYALGDVVLFAGASYASVVDGNHGNTPGLSPAYWGVLTAQGPQGVQGLAGLTGAAGPVGAPGSVGPPGERGDQGLQGIAGQAGAQGLTGVGGAQGLSGPMGPQGVAGPVGMAFRGAYDSTVNYAVADGVSFGGAGYVSLVGSNHGNTPDQSPQFWAVFAVGTQGVAGAPGLMGAAGAQGLQGPVGLVGANGPAGSQGAAGLQGPTGVAGPVGMVFRGAYVAGTAYGVGDAVSFGGSSYISRVAGNVGQAPELSSGSWGLLAVAGAGGANGVDGAVGAQGLAGVPGVAGPQGPVGATGSNGAVGMNFRGAWTAGSNYAVNDAVTWAGSTYLAESASRNAEPDVSAQSWAVLAAAGNAGVGATGATGAQGPAGPQGINGAAGASGPQGPAGLNYLGSYASAANYGVADAVSFGGSTFVSLVGANHGNEPDISPEFWAVLAARGETGAAGVAGPAGLVGATGADGAVGAVGAQGPPVAFAGGWLVGRSYAVGDAVSYGGGSYIAVAANAGREPDVSPVYWGVLATGGVAGPAGQVGAMGLQGPTGGPGAVGPSGPAGVAGATGAQGVAGGQGVQGPAGPVGSVGATGAQGLVFRGAYVSATNYALGDAVSFGGASYVSLVAGNVGQTPGLAPSNWGLLAMAGATGANGDTGAAGEVGPQGLPGAVGATGGVGSQGPAGAAGAAGPQGVAGVQGPVGAVGPAGANGVAGAMGAAGAPGAVGPQGVMGIAGPTGAAGAVGMNFRGAWTQGTNYAVNDAVTFSGSTFLAGSANKNREPDAAPDAWTVVAQAGGAGPTGAAGVAGVAATVAVGKVTTLAAGSQASVSNSGTAGAAVLNFGIPQGAAGTGGVSGGNGFAGGSFAAVYHAVSFSTAFYAVNAPTAAAGETAAVLAWVPRGCSAVRLDVFSQQANTVTVTLRNGKAVAMADTALSCSAASGGSCTATGAVAIAAGSFTDLSVTGASGDAAGVWTQVECD